MKKICYLLSAIILAGCAKEPAWEKTPGGGSSPDKPATLPAKVIRLGDKVLTGSFLVKMESGAECEDVFQLLQPIGAKSVKKVFTHVEGKEELEKRFGMDRWFEVILEEGTNIDNAVLATAKISSVATVQYNIEMKKASDGKVYPYEGPEVATKASGSAIFNDPMLGDQWHYINTGSNSGITSAYAGGDINVETAWRELTCGDPSIIVAVVDEGVKYSHPDLAANMWRNTGEIPDNKIDDDGNGFVDDVHGYNFVDDGEISWDIYIDEDHSDSGHGTHCAGTIAAVNNNGTGVAGVAGGSGKGDGCRLMSCQIFSGGYGGTAAITADAIKYAADNGASIISCSFGYEAGAVMNDAEYIQYNSVEANAIHYFEATKNNDVLDGGVAIFASGNDGKPYSCYPGGLHDIICVSAFAPDYLPTYYTNYGPGCNIVSPGGEAYLNPFTHYRAMVLSTVPSELDEKYATGNGKGYHYGYMQGTSMATPHVSGVAALGLSYAKKIGKTFTVQEFKNLLLTSTNNLDNRILTSTKNYDSRYDVSLNLTKFRYMLGTGAVDVWKFMMNIEGTPCLEAVTGKKQTVDLSPYFGGQAKNLTYLGVEISSAGRESLGLAEDPKITNGRLNIHPTKPGAGKIVVRAIAGGDQLGGGNKLGGMEISREISVVARAFKAENGGWL